MSIEIQRAEIGQLEQLASLFNQYRVWYHQEPDIDRARKFLEERLANGDSTVFIAFNNGMPAGFTQLYPIFTSVGMTKAWLLNDLFVHEDHRGLGIASKLLEKAKELGRLTGSKWLMLQTGFDNTNAQALYQKNGWDKIPDQFYEFIL